MNGIDTVNEYQAIQKISGVDLVNHIAFNSEQRRKKTGTKTSSFAKAFDVYIKYNKRRGKYAEISRLEDKREPAIKDVHYMLSKNIAPNGKNHTDPSYAVNLLAKEYKLPLLNGTPAIKDSVKSVRKQYRTHTKQIDKPKHSFNDAKAIGKYHITGEVPTGWHQVKAHPRKGTSGVKQHIAKNPTRK
ncbi:MAG: hypothetical protein QM613_01515 [Micrococcaceae bacterium]